LVAVVAVANKTLARAMRVAALAVAALVVYYKVRFRQSPKVTQSRLGLAALAPRQRATAAVVVILYLLQLQQQVVVAAAQF
jgi:hypothetical protein